MTCELLFVARHAKRSFGDIRIGKIPLQELVSEVLRNMQATKGVQMRKLCDKKCYDCTLEECLLKQPPYDWMATERTRTENSKQQRKEYLKKKREICIAFGVCRDCLSRDAVKGNYCLECYIKNKKRNEAKRKDIARYDRASYGLCYFCGKPVEPGQKTCKEHHEIMAGNVKRTDYSNNKNHIWRKQNKLIYAKRGGNIVSEHSESQSD